jgi:uncharacterized membrane protein
MPDALRESATGRHRRPVSPDVALKQSVKQSLRTPYREARELRDPVLWAITGGVLLVSCVLSLSRYIRVSPATWDLGIFTEAIHRYAHLQSPTVDIKAPGFDLLGDHFHPILVLLAPCFRVFPTPVTLLVAQALLTALSVIPVYRAGHQLLGQTEARLLAAAYGFSWGLAAMNAYDFHEIWFAVPLLAASLSCLVRGNVRGTVLWAMPLVFVKEDQGLTLAALGVVMMLFYVLRREGLFVTCWGVAWSTVTVYVVIPRSTLRMCTPTGITVGTCRAS